MYRKSGNSEYELRKTITGCSYTLIYSKNYGKTYKFKIVPKNSAGSGTPKEIEYTTPPYDHNPTTAWNQYLAEMLGYYKKELQDNYGVNINSTSKTDEFKKILAMIAVMQKYVGYGERGTNDHSRFPTGAANWFYNDGLAAVNHTNMSGNYYDGTKYIPTIKFYASCDIVADTQEYLAKQAGLKFYTFAKANSGHSFVMICANNVWYNADPESYMVPGKGLNNPKWNNLSVFAQSEYYCDIEHSLSDGKTFSTSSTFTLGQVFYGSGSSVSSTGGISILNGPGQIGINPANATYTSSDESILSFDNVNGTCTFHKEGTVYVTIVYQNVKPGNQPVPSITTTISVSVTS